MPHALENVPVSPMLVTADEGGAVDKVEFLDSSPDLVAMMREIIQDLEDTIREIEGQVATN